MHHCTYIDPTQFLSRERADDPRLGESARVLKKFDDARAGSIVILGIPDERGAIVNGGRAGAAEGPVGFRRAFYTLPGTWEIFEAGDIILGATNRETHERIASAVALLLAKNAIPIVIGGSHDVSFGGLQSAVAHDAKLQVINIDAHLDVRPSESTGDVNSGTTFRRLVDDAKCDGARITQWGYHPHVASAQHLAWARAQKMRLWSWKDLHAPDPLTLWDAWWRERVSRNEPVALSLDCDAIDGAALCGVSAPAMVGFSPTHMQAMLHLAGSSQLVRYFDCMELAPALDPTPRSMRLAAFFVWSFINGWMQGASV